jgi:GT2 family glycosyltransferase
MRIKNASNFPTIDIIIVNWNSGTQLQECLESIVQYGKAYINQVTVVDNGSIDNSLGGIELIDLPLVVIRNVTNCGFAAACNQGAAKVSSDYLLFLNPDTRLFENSLSMPLAFMEQPENKEVGIVGIQLIDDNQKISKSCSRFPSVGTFVAHALAINRLPRLLHLSQVMLEWDHTNTQQVDQVMGAFFLIRYSVFRSLGGFDERFFVYFEEVDLSFRAKLQGWHSIYLAQAQAYHKGGGVSEQVKAHRLFYSLRSRIHYAFKHFSRISAWTVVITTLVVEPITRLIRGALRLSTREILDTAHGFVMLWKDVPSILSKTKL